MEESSGAKESATNISEMLSEKIIGQSGAIGGIASAITMYQAGLAPEGRPAGIFLLLGPTGTGKTRTVEALAEILHKDSKRVVKINCGEYQSDHEIAKLIGSPPGYLGHKETKPMLTQDRLEEVTTACCNLSLVLFDEIEKAAPSISKLLLGVLDKASLRLGDNTEVRFEKTLIFLTSNLGAREMMKELQPEMGFRPAPRPAGAVEAAEVVTKLETIALNAVRRMYSPEFVNRLDAVITYRPLGSEALALILDLQIADLQQHVNNRLSNRCFNIDVSKEARRFLLEKGTSPEYGARELKRSIHRYLTQPLATLVMESKIPAGSTVNVVLQEDGAGLSFTAGAAEKLTTSRRPAMLIVDDNRDFLRLLSLQLTTLKDWRVHTAQFAEEAKEIRAAESIDFALLDLILPDGNGIELGIELRHLDPKIHVVIMTGGELSKNEERLCREHDFDTVNKPFLPENIVSLVRERSKRIQGATA